MELPESKNEIDELKQPTKTKRRISSILKAPRTPLKSIRAENEDCQEETAKPTEHRRKSRRVSFASTNDIHVFIKDFKNGSSLENLQDLSGTGEETLDNAGVHAAKDGGQQIIGMETLLNAPLHVSQQENKENIFGYGGQNDFCSKTVVFSEEDTAFMDMTHSHTIIIDDKADGTDAAISSCRNHDFTAGVGEAETAGFENSRKEVTTFKCSTSGKGPIKESEFEDFLALLTQSSGSGRLSSNMKSASSVTPFAKAPSPAPKVDTKNFLTRLRAKENQVPVATRMSAHQDGSSQQRSHWLNDKTISVEQENMDLTKTHTAIIGNEGLFTCKSFAPSEEPDDMEMTKSQTVDIRSKTYRMVNSSNSSVRGLSMMAQNKTVMFSEADHDMEMTAAFTGHLEVNKPSSTLGDETSISSFPAANTISGQKDFSKMTSSQIVNVCNKGLWPTTLSDPDDMEMTRSQTVDIRSKTCQMVNSSNGTVRGPSMLAPNKTVMFSEADHDMEMTGAFTGHLEVNKPSSTLGDETSISSFPATNPISGPTDFSKMTSSQKNVIVCNKSLWPTTLSDPDDMEMTRSQTVDIRSKTCQMVNSSNGTVRGPSMLAPNKTVMFSEADHDMEMTGAVTGHLEVNKPSSTLGDETSISSFPAANTISGQKDFSKMTSSQIVNVCNKGLWPTTLSDPDDMEMTRSQTVDIRSKTCQMVNSSNGTVRGPSMLAPNKTVMFSEADHDMEMTGAFTGHLEVNEYSTLGDETSISSFPATNTISGQKDFSKTSRQIVNVCNKSVWPTTLSNPDHMEMTRSQTVHISSKTCQMVNSSNSSVRGRSMLAPNKTIIFSEADHDMEITGAFPGHLEVNKYSLTLGDEACISSFPATNTISGQKDFSKMTSSQIVNVCNKSLWPTTLSNPDDMEMTRSQTVDISSKTSQMVNLSNSTVRGLSMLGPNKTVIFSEADHDMEMTGAVTGHLEVNEYSSTLGDETGICSFPATNTISGQKDFSKITSNHPDDMEMTRSQTVDIDSKYFGTAKTSLGTVRKNLSCVLPASKPLIFPTKYCGMQVPKALVGLDMDSKTFPTSGNGTATTLSPTANNVTASDEPAATGGTQSQTAARDPDGMEMGPESKHGVKQNPLPVAAKRNVYYGSDSNQSQILSEDNNGIEMPKALVGLTVASGHPPTDGDEMEITFPSDKAKSAEISTHLISSSSSSTLETVQSTDLENERSLSVHIDTRNGEMANSLTSIMSKGPLSVSSTTQFFSETDDNIVADENMPAPADGVERQACTTATVPPPCLPNCQTVAEENTGRYGQIAFVGTTLLPADLTVLGEMSCNAPLMNYTVTSDEGTSHTANSGNLLPTDSSEIGHDGKETDKQAKSRRMSLVDLQSKLQNIGHMMTEKFDLERGCQTAPIPRLTTSSSPEAKEAACLPTVQLGIDDDGGGANSCMRPDDSKSDRKTNRTETSNLSKSKPWTPKLSSGGFLPKLPRRSKPLDLNQEDPAGHCDLTMLQRKSKVSVEEKDGDVKNINEETLPEISSEDDLSETIEGGMLRDRDQEASVGQTVMDAELIQNITQGQKRPFPVDGHECDMPEERKMRSLSISCQELEPSTKAVQYDSHVVDIVGENPSSFMTRTLDSTNFTSSSPDHRCEGTLEMSAHRSSQYDIQFDEPNEINVQQKLEDGSITTREFLKLFGINFNILRPRQSVLPENFEAESAPNAAAVLLEKHINRPKQRVYEEDCQELAEMVEKLKTRMRDQDKSLRTTNEALWEVVKAYSEEQLQSFGTKLKERKVYFRKKSKSLSHGLKIGLHSKLVRTTQIAQQSLTEKIEDMDELLKHLDDCVNDLQADLSSMDCAGVEEEGMNSETKLTIEVKQQELESLDMTLADNDRRVCELELEKKNTIGKVRKLQSETVELGKQMAVLDRLTEWRLAEKTDDRAVFTFLYDSMGLEVLFEKPAAGDVTGAETEQKVADITFQLELDEKNSRCFACLVHCLLSQFIQSEGSWVHRYPTSGHVPVLLRDVSLVVSRCRLLGDEIHRLQKWGSLRLDILEIGCVGTQVRILFSSLKAFAKFELTLAVTPAYPFTGLQLIDFQNYIGNTRINQVEEILCTEAPANGYLTRVVKRIHSALLCSEELSLFSRPLS